MSDDENQGGDDSLTRLITGLGACIAIVVAIVGGFALWPSLEGWAHKVKVLTVVILGLVEFMATLGVFMAIYWAIDTLAGMLRGKLRKNR